VNCVLSLEREVGLVASKHYDHIKHRFPYQTEENDFYLCLERVDSIVVGIIVGSRVERFS
jgi:hypothetical protein